MDHAREFEVSTQLQKVIDLFTRAGARPHPDKPTAAAGLVLLRDSADGLEVFITRSKDDKGLTDPNRWAFPTRQALSSDTVRMPLAVWDAGDCAHALRMENKSRALSWFTAAARVAFMRLGIVLASRPGGQVVTSVDFPWLDDARTGIAERRQKLSALLRAQNLVLRLDLLHPWLRWVNSDWQLRRFDTVYFVAVMPAGQQVRFRASLDVFGGWMRPADVLAQADAAAQRAGAVPNEFISIPTRLICESLVGQRTVGSAMLRVRDLAPIQSGLVWRSGVPMISLDPQEDPTERGSERAAARTGQGAAAGEPADEPDGDEEEATGLTGGAEFADEYADGKRPDDAVDDDDDDVDDVEAPTAED